MKMYFADQFVLPLPEGHRFPISKYALLRQRIQENQLAGPGELLVPAAASDTQLRRVHTAAYLEKVLTGTLSEKEIRRIGFPWSPQLVERSRRSVGGTIAACRAALETGVAANLAGGTHHAYADHGEGFCVFNDGAVAARTLQDEGRTEKILFLDLDVHQGNGTAAIFRTDASVFTASVHGAKNFPFHKEESDLDIALEDGTRDDVYLNAVITCLEQIEIRFRPDLVIYLAGSDPYVGDRLGRMAVSKSGLARRDQLVFEWCQTYALPIAVVMAGGYAREVEDSVDIHYQTIRLAAEHSQQNVHPSAL
ncbi:MAG: histone deacetylase [Anaerolineales bacterium]|jgi:acetoin utilization deacetylase AcuC-like enzyme